MIDFVPSKLLSIINHPMRIEFLGTRGKVKSSAPSYNNHTGILIDDQILIDVGEPAFLQAPHKIILFTHYHPDHAYFISEDQAFMVDTLHFGPESHPLLPHVKLFDSELVWEGYHIRSFPVMHALNLQSIGYIVEKNGLRVMITGDVAWIEKRVLDRMPSVDLICTEATFIKKGGRINQRGEKIFGHTGIPDLIRILSPLTKRIAFAHYGEWFFSCFPRGPQMISRLAPPGMELITAKDGAVVKL